MPWNQPSGPQSPWGRRPGGPDLDERLKSWQRKLESMFRPGGKGTDSGTLFLVVVAIAVLAWLWSGVYQVKQPERGVVQRFGRLTYVTLPGLHFRLPWPIESVNVVNVSSVNSSDFKSRVLTSDVNLVDLHFAVQYQFSDPVKKLFRVRNPEDTLSEVSESAIREIVGRSTLNDLLVGSTRPEVTRRTKELIQSVLDNYNTGITVTTVNLEDVQVPDAVIPSQRDANTAQADKERLQLEAEAYRNGILPVAQGAAARMLQDAQAYKSQVTAIAEGQASRFAQIEGAYAQAPEVTRRRLYTDAIENVLSHAHKVIIDSRAGSNLVYLPIDKLLEKSINRESESGSDNGAGASKDQTDQVTIEGTRARGER
ncbi:MAG: FtsH protease activity modulator HflK [Steroidobacteraceae bacterium]